MRISPWARKAKIIKHPSILDTITLASSLHADQVDKLGVPYYFHPMRVMARLGSASTEAEKHAALLHDVLEDVVHATADFLREQGYTEEEIEMCQLLRRLDGETYPAFIDRIIASGNVGAMRIKLSDLYDNTDEERAIGASSDVRRQLVDMADNRYRPAIAKLKLALGHFATTVTSGPLTFDHNAVKHWKKEARRLSEGTLLSRFPIRVVEKHGLFTPWYLPMFWFTRSGVFAFPPFIAVTRDVVEACPRPLVRPILAHEIGHLHKLHSVFWFAFILLFFKLGKLLIAFAGNHFAPYGQLWAFIGLIVVAAMATFRIQHWFERSADDYAVEVAGPDLTIKAIKWAKQHIHGDRSIPWIDGRIARLEARHATH